MPPLRADYGVSFRSWYVEGEALRSRTTNQIVPPASR